MRPLRSSPRKDTAELHDELRDHPAWTTAALEPIAGEAHAQIARAQKPQKTTSARRSRPTGPGSPVTTAATDMT
jgi:hypothetical protein